jgi:hypothetical protein
MLFCCNSRDAGLDTIRQELQTSCVEGVTLSDVSGLKTLAEPTNSLLGGTVSKRVRNHIPLHLALEPIVADRTCGSKRFLDVP